MEKNIIAFLSVFLLSTTLCAQVQVEQFKPTFFEFDNSRDCKDVKLINYKHMGKIAFPISQ